MMTTEAGQLLTGPRPSEKVSQAFKTETHSRTYSLRAGATVSDGYYTAISSLADRWLDRVESRVVDPLNGFQEYCQSVGLPQRSFQEYAFELLAMGVLLRERGNEAASLPTWAALLLTNLVKLQEKLPVAQDLIKSLRGLVNGLIPADDTAVPCGDELGCLIRWLRAQGKTVQADYFSVWHDYFDKIGILPSEEIIILALELANEFARESQPVLGRFTSKVEAYVSGIAPAVRYRYDAALVTSTRLEYHLGMLGTEILDRAFRQRYLAAAQKIVITPNCLRAQPDGKCRAIQTPMGAVCQGCTTNCRVHKITQMCKKSGIPVFNIPDDALHRLCVKSGQAGSGLGVVGLSCVLNNWVAGWESDRLGLAAQGVLLDCAGCQKHWDEKGFTTNVNMGKLKDVIGIN